MIKFENTEVMGWEHAIRGMRNPMNSWEKSDSDYRPILCKRCDNCMSYQLEHWEDCDDCEVNIECDSHNGFIVGPNDRSLMMNLRSSGKDHRKFMRMIVVYVDITAPLYWWKEFDTYKVGTVANSCSTMHKIHEKGFMLEDFSTEHLVCLDDFRYIIDILNCWRSRYIQYDEDPTVGENLGMSKKDVWWQMIQLLPSSYNQKRTVMLNYEVLANIYESRKNHKLDEWRIGFMEWIESLPYSELICGPEFLKRKLYIGIDLSNGDDMKGGL